MRRATITILLLLGWMALIAACALPIASMFLSLLDVRRISTGLVHVPPRGKLLLYSLTVAMIGSGLAITLGLVPAILIGARSRWRGIAFTGLCVSPLLVPPQIYAYAWGLATAPHRLLAAALPPLSSVGAWGSAVRAGLISAGWLWPIVALIVAAGWRATGRSVYTLALLDTTSSRAFFRAVLPSLRSYILAAACVVFAITMVEYPIPHLSLARTYGTELLLLVDVGAPAGQVIQSCLPALACVTVLLLTAGRALSSTGRWGAVDDEHVEARVGSSQFWPTCVLLLTWAASVAVPVGVLIGSLRGSRAWREAFTLFQREWLVSFGVSIAAGAVTMLISLATIGWAAGQSGRRAALVRLGAIPAGAGALVPAAALGIGFIRLYNRPGVLGDLYTETPLIWILALAARYCVVTLVICWLAVRKRWVIGIEQARVDGASAGDILATIVLPTLWPSLLVGGAVVTLLSLSEVVVSQLVAPVGNPSIALTILNLMHYGRDDTVIVASLLIVAVGVLLAQLGSWLLLRRR